ncbi:MAG: hypothetical protein GW748_03150 [Alphaproteobacteria bacterium]|nr:hypothetical protein [Alphaproteobacteria bacterium]NCQ66723.1 hypothetical protein [Alphaproteobacteria bacterium]NCT07174.1 hypothetical protein [Alphaproteobacteria bacterium]
MKKTLKTSLLLSFFCFTNISTASIRVDVEDRDKETVLKKSVRLAKALPTAQTTGVIISEIGELFSAVALDPYTLLTCAHIKSLQDGSPMYFNLEHTNEKTFRLEKQLLKTPPFIPDNFLFTIPEKDYITINHNNDYCINDIPLTDLSSISFEEILSVPHPISGPDIAIFKLSNPLPTDLTYPNLIPEDFDMNASYGLSIGFGPMKYNIQETGPTLIPLNTNGYFPRHVISCKVNSYSGYIYGSYESLLMNGNESFIPSSEMRKTEGLPVGGDSGSPFFIEDSGNYYLAGIFSTTRAGNTHHITDQELRSKVNELTQNDLTQRIFPLWTDLRKHINWIQQYLGPIQTDLRD